MTPEELRKTAAEARAELLATQQGLSVGAQTSANNNSGTLEENARAAKEELAVNRQELINQNLLPEPVPSALDKIFTQPFERATARMEGTFDRVLSTPPTMQEQMTDPQSLESAYVNNTSLPSVLLQVGGAPISLSLDVLGSGIGVGASKAYGLLPDSTKQGVSEFFIELGKTEVGNKAIQAASNGVEAYEDFKAYYPNMAADIEVGLDIFGGVPKQIIKNFSPDLNPLVLQRVGMRNELRPLQGVDKDIYNIAYSGPDQKRTIQQAETTTDPQGVLGIQGQRATDNQLNVIDDLKAVGVSGNKTLQQNFNKVIEGLDRLDDELIAASRKLKQPIEVANIRENLNQGIKQLKEQLPDLFNSPEINKKITNAYVKMMAKLEEQGYSVEGVIQARRAFDSEMKRQGIDAGSSQINPGIVASRVVRDAVNRSIAQVMPESPKILSKRSNLLSVYDNIGNNAANEAKTSFGRYVAELGLDSMSGENFTSRIINSAYILGFTPVMAPYYFMKQSLKRPSPARGRAKVGYVLRDIKDEITKGIEKTKDPVKRRALLANKPVVFGSLEEAARTLMEEEDY
tara:strand:- start:1934 stop:3652 length:1719 start_codon:yes stop_codon:yes gene_type:complete